MMTAIQWSLKIANQREMFLFGGHIEFLCSSSLMPIYVGNFFPGGYNLLDFVRYRRAAGNWNCPVIPGVRVIPRNGGLLW